MKKSKSKFRNKNRLYWIMTAAISIMVIGGCYWYLAKINNLNLALNYYKVGAEKTIERQNEEINKLKSNQEARVWVAWYKGEDESVYIEDKNVYLSSGSNEITVAKSIEDPDNEVKNFIYREAELSPNGEYIFLSGTGWEAISHSVYQIESQKMYKLEDIARQAGILSGTQAGWLVDGRLRIVGECGMGISCGVYESTSADRPWELKKVSEYSDYYRATN